MTGTAGFLENLQSMPLCGSFILYLVGETTYSLMVLPLSCMHESGDFSVSSLDLLRTVVRKSACVSFRIICTRPSLALPLVR